MNTRNIFIAAGILLVVVVLIILNKKDDKVLIQYRVPSNPSPDVFGPSYWSAFHNLASRIPCGGCRGFAEKFMVFFHDTVNKKLSKPLYDPDNFNKFVMAYASLASGTDFATAFKEI